MDVTGWTIDQKMRLPDWVFGNRKTMSVTGDASGEGTTSWWQRTVALPAVICIWQVMILPLRSDGTSSYIRIGLRATVPTSEAEMNECIAVMPGFGTEALNPPKIFLSDGAFEVWKFDLRKGLDTESKKLTVEIHCGHVRVSTIVLLVYSEMPTHMAGWLAHHKV